MPEKSPAFTTLSCHLHDKNFILKKHIKSKCKNEHDMKENTIIKDENIRP